MVGVSGIRTDLKGLSAIESENLIVAIEFFCFVLFLMAISGCASPLQYLVTP